MSISIAADAIIRVLKAEMPPLVKAEQIGLCSPADAGDRFLLGVFIHAAARDTRTQAMGNMRVDASTSVKGPLITELHLIVTSYAGKKSGLLDDYKILERVAQLWHDHSELPMNTQVQPSRVVTPKFELQNPDADEISKIWQFPGVPYSLSLFYRLAPVAIPSGVQITKAPVGDVDYKAGDS
ncbi:MAG: DUF4255 domain-containing protein [Clostridiales Family XIII bacterium]|jgi:hypothetical protein|nr:DUF4255 domain-containing protein [Clostridiales Family XIII bacterium]